MPWITKFCSIFMIFTCWPLSFCLSFIHNSKKNTIFLTTGNTWQDSGEISFTSSVCNFHHWGKDFSTGKCPLRRGTRVKSQERWLLFASLSIYPKTFQLVPGLSERHATLPCIPWRVATDFYNSVPVSSSHGLTSMRRLDLAMTAFSIVKKTLKKQQKKQSNIYTSLLYCWNFSPVAQVLNGYFEFTHLGSQAIVICKL